MSIVARIANVISAGRIHLDCVTAMIPLMTVVFIFITVSFFCWFGFRFLRTAGSQIHFRLRSPDSCVGCQPQQQPDFSSGFAPAGVAPSFVLSVRVRLAQSMVSITPLTECWRGGSAWTSGAEANSKATATVRGMKCGFMDDQAWG